MVSYSSVKGTHDLFFDQLNKFLAIEEQVKKVASKYSFNEIRTPIIEHRDVFEKNIGSNTDVITKEMFAFNAKNGDELVLRPEGTAPVVRAALQGGMHHQFPAKFFYIGPMFRYERPQKGRQRQFHQFGFEYLGTQNYIADIEIILSALDLLNKLGIDKHVLLLNSLGGSQTLNKYKMVLLEYLRKYTNDLSNDSLIRLKNNPLRILDSKDPNDQRIIADAPKLYDCLTKEDILLYDTLRDQLTQMGIKFQHTDSLVRGLDYYNHMVFEIVSDELGAQNTLIAGGRYDGLLKQMGGPDLGACGYAGGVERLMLLLDHFKRDLVSEGSVAIITFDSSCNHYGLNIAQEIRDDLNLAANFILGKDVKAKLKRASLLGYKWAVLLGEAEVAKQQFVLKDLINFSQIVCDSVALKEHIKSGRLCN